MVGDDFGKALNLSVQFGSDRLHAEPFKGINQSVREAVQAVSVLHNAFPLHIVENFAHLLGRKFVVIEE